MAEWSIAAVLKTVELRGSGGSNPSLSATKIFAKATIRKDGRFYFVVARLNLFSKSTSKIKSSLREQLSLKSLSIKK